MNGKFRSPELIKRYEYSYFDLQTPLSDNVGANNRQTKDNYMFVVDNSPEVKPIDWYNAYIELNFKLLALNQAQDEAGITAGTGNVNTFCTTTNAQTFIHEIQVECNGIAVYNNTKADDCSNVLSLLKHTRQYADSVGKDNFFYVDTKTGTAEPRAAENLCNKGFSMRKILTLTDAGNEIKISIPLSLYSYFAAFKNNLHPNIKMSILIRLSNDNNIIFRNAAAPNSKVLIIKFRLWCPKIILNGVGMKMYLENYVKPRT